MPENTSHKARFGRAADGGILFPSIRVFICTSYGSQIKTAEAASYGVIPSAAERAWSEVEGSKSRSRALRSDLSTAVRLWLTFGRDDGVSPLSSISV